MAERKPTSVKMCNELLGLSTVRSSIRSGSQYDSGRLLTIIPPPFRLSTLPRETLIEPKSILDREFWDLRQQRNSSQENGPRISSVDVVVEEDDDSVLPSQPEGTPSKLLLHFERNNKTGPQLKRAQKDLKVPDFKRL